MMCLSSQSQRKPHALWVLVCACVCVHERAPLTCRTYHRMYATRFPCAKRKCINLFTFL